jgi:competence protein ComFC
MSILDLIFPKTCLGCKKDGQYICQNCLVKVQLLKPVCPYCEKPSIDGFTHTRCKKKYGLDGLISVYRYEGVIKKAIWALKFKYATEVGKELTDFFVRSLHATDYILPATFSLVPIPIYRLRENFRGFNQSELIGKMVAEELGYKFTSDLLVKNKPTISQVELSVKERKKNLRGSFSLNQSSFLTPDSSILVFDDVFTTGSTLHEAAKVLKHAGVSKVWGMTIAR